jgi:hypothetical protein
MGFNRGVMTASSRSAPAVLVAALALNFFSLSSSGCARGGDATPRGSDGSRLDAGTSPGDDARAPGDCDPACPLGEMCLGGECVPAEDADGDGIDGTRDCDDSDPSIGTMAERACEGPCGPGVERCTEGVWAACTAPATCDCEPDAAPRELPCGNCGVQRQVCSEGRWENDGTCTGAGPCSPGDIDTGGSCGNCGTQRRSCGLDCSWGGWACEGEGVCVAGETQRETRACGNCGTQSRTRTCGASTCAWGDWSAFGTCSGEGVCAAGATRACANGDPCGHEVCSTSCTWGACQPLTPTGCLRIRPGTSGPVGNNYRCCPLTPTDDGWQFCLSTCQWSTACEATTSC